jgi:hypothetical protein
MQTPSARGAATARACLVAACSCLVILLALCVPRGARAQTPATQVTCVEGRCVTPAALPANPTLRLPGRPGALPRLTRGMAFFGIASAAVILSGAIWLGTSDSQHWERVGRSVMLGLSMASTPLMAVSSLVTRRRARVKGVPALRRFMWAGYLSSVSTDGFFLYRALHDDQASLGASIAAGALSAITVLGYAYDAFQTSRQAAFSQYSLRVSPIGATLHGRF